MHIRQTAILLLFSPLVLAPSLNAAAEGRVPIFEPTTITESGTYYVSSSLTSPTSDAIIISAPNVSIDLNGLTISAPGDAVIRVAAGVENLRIESGVLEGGQGIIFATQTTNFSLQDVTITTGGIALIANSRHFSIADCVFDGIVVLEGGAGRFERNIVTSGLNALDLNSVSRSIITENYMTGGGGSTVTFDGQSRHNYFADNIVDGADAGASEIFLSANSGFNIIERNRTPGPAPGVGVESAGNRIVANLFSTAGDQVLSIGGSNNYIADNTLTGGADCAILFANSDGHIYRENIMRGLDTSGDPTQGPICGFANTNGGGNICDTDCCELTCP